MTRPHLVDGLQYANWSEKIFRQMREGGLDAVHVTIAYHETFREMVHNIERWNRRFEQHPDLIFQGRSGRDVRLARETGRTAIFFGFQNPSPIEDDIGLVEVCHALGVRFMQLSYNNQSLLAIGCFEAEDPGITRMGREVIKEMNQVGLVVDMSHSAERSTLEAIEISERPIVISHANPAFWHPARRNKSDEVLRALGRSGGMLGFSVYPHHLKGQSDCSLESFAEMVARTAEIMGPKRIGLGTDLCQDQPDGVVEWMRVGRWTKDVDYGEGSRAQDRFRGLGGQGARLERIGGKAGAAARRTLRGTDRALRAAARAGIRRRPVAGCPRKAERGGNGRRLPPAPSRAPPYRAARANRRAIGL